MIPPSAAMRRAALMLMLIDPVDRRRTGARLKILQSHPHHDGRSRERGRLCGAAEHVRSEQAQSVCLQHRDGAAIGIQCVGIQRVLSSRECGGDVAADRDYHRRGALRIEQRVQMNHPVPLEHRQ